MPRLSPSGLNVAMGVAGHQGVINGEFIPDSYGPQWYNEATVVFQQPSNNAIVLYNINTKKRTPQLIKDSNNLSAGGNIWALWASGYGLLSSQGFYSVDAGLLDVGPDGAVGYVPVRQADFGAKVKEIDNVDWVLTTSNVVYSLQLLGNRRAIYHNQHNNIVTFGIPQCIQIGNAFHPRAVEIVGEWWVLYFSTDAGVVFHPFNSTIGYRIAETDAHVWQHAVASLGGDVVKIVWSDRAGEAPEDYRERLINVFTESRIELKPSIPKPPEATDVMIPSFDRPMWMAPYYSHHIRYGDTPLIKHVGNAIAVIGDERDESVRDSELQRIFPLGQPMIVDAGTHPPSPTYLNTTVAWLIGAGTIQQLVDLSGRIIKDYPELPIIAYLDSTNWPDSKPFNSERIWPSIQAYRFPTETLEQFRNRVFNCIQKVSRYGLPMSLVTRFDDFNGSSTIQRTLECMPIYESWLRDFNFVTHMPFADRRGNGISANEALWNWARAFQYAIPSQRPNRFDYWKPQNASIESVWKNKRGQSRAAIVMEPYMRDWVDSLINGSDNGDDKIPVISQRMYDIVWALYEKYKSLAEGSDDQRRQLTKMIAEQNRLEFGERWGTKSTSSGSPQSKDAIAYKVDSSTIHVWDWQSGSTRKPQIKVGDSPDYLFLKQHFISVQPVNHLP